MVWYGDHARLGTEYRTLSLYSEPCPFTITCFSEKKRLLFFKRYERGDPNLAIGTIFWLGVRCVGSVSILCYLFFIRVFQPFRSTAANSLLAVQRYALDLLLSMLSHPTVPLKLHIMCTASPAMRAPIGGCSICSI